jgi:hypothetical protein
MRIYIFKSETNGELRAFAGDLTGTKLPQNHGPWTGTGVIGPNNEPPYNFSRDAIEEAIDKGFQLWRLRKKAQSRTSTFLRRPIRLHLIL